MFSATIIIRKILTSIFPNKRQAWRMSRLLRQLFWIPPCCVFKIAFRGMHVSPAKHSYAWLSRKCDYRTDRHTHTQTDAGQSDPDVGPKWSLCAAMLRRRHNKNWLLKSDEEAHNAGQISDPYVTQRFSLYNVYKIISIYVHCDLDLWPPKSIGIILSPWLTCLPSLMKKHTTV